MHWTQIAYPCLLAFAIWVGRPDGRIALLLAGNFIGTLILAPWPAEVAVLDLSTAVLLISIRKQQSLLLAFVFALLVPVGIMGHFGELTPGTIYTIADLSAIAIIALIVGPGGGKRIRDLGYSIGRLGVSVAVSLRHSAARAFAQSSVGAGRTYSENKQVRTGAQHGR